MHASLSSFYTCSGDDEQSDFFHETGPACGIASIVPWWENEALESSEAVQDPNFEKILNGAFHCMSATSKHNVKLRLELVASEKVARQFCYFLYR